MMCLFHSNLKSILFQVYILYNTSPPEWMLTRKTSYCVIWYFGRCFGKQEIDMFVAIQCHLWLQYVNRTLTFPKSNINKCTTLHYVAHLLEEMTSFLASIICYYKLLLMTSLSVDVAWGSPHNIHSYTAQYLHIGRHTVVWDTGKTLKTIRSQVPSNLTGNNTTDVLTVGILHLYIREHTITSLFFHDIIPSQIWAISDSPQPPHLIDDVILPNLSDESLSY